MKIIFQEMYRIIIAFICGALIVPGIKKMARMLFHYYITPTKQIIHEVARDTKLSAILQKEIKKAQIFNNNMSWINVLVQRIYSEMIRSYYFEDKIKQSIAKSICLSISENLVKDIKVLKIDYPKEAPYLRFLKLISNEDFQKFTRTNQGKISKISNTSFVPRIDDNFRKSKAKSNKEINFNAMSNLNKFNKAIHTNNYKKNKKINDENIAKENFKSLSFYGHFVFNDNLKIHTQCKILRSFLCNANVCIMNVESDFIVKMPADNNSGRFEIALVNNPTIIIDVETSLQSKQDRKYFKDKLNGILRKSVLSYIRNTIIYPNFYQIIQPFIGSIKNINFYPKAIKDESVVINRQNTDDILCFMGYDYNIESIKNKPIFRKSCFTLNNMNTVISYTLSFGQVVDFEVIESCNFLNIFSRKMHHLETIKYNTYQVYRYVRDNRQIEYIKSTYKDWIVFYCNDPNFCEFFILDLFGTNAIIYSYSDNKQYILDDKDIENIKNHISINIEEKIEKVLPIKILEIVKMANIKTYKYNLKIKDTRLREYLARDLIRWRILENYYLKEIDKKSNMISKLTFHYNNKEKIIYSYYENCKWIDISDNYDTFTIFNISKTPDISIADYKFDFQVNSTDIPVTLTIESNSDSFSPNSFLEALKIREGLEQFLVIADNIKMMVNDRQVHEEIKVNKGVIYIEFNTKTEGLYKIELFSCKQQKIIFNIDNISSVQKFRLIYPVENDYINIKILPLQKEDIDICYKIHNCLESDNVFLVDATVGIKHKKKLKFDINGSPAHFLFWEHDSIDILQNYVIADNIRTMLKPHGLLRSENQKYTLVYKNKSKEFRYFNIFTGLINMN